MASVVFTDDVSLVCLFILAGGIHNSYVPTALN